MATQNFRKSFHVASRELIRWFPGHMGKGLKQMQQRLKQVDCIIGEFSRRMFRFHQTSTFFQSLLEVHDARIPISGRNTEFHYTLTGAKPHILVLNKKDCIEPDLHKKVIAKVRKDSEFPVQNVIMTNCKDQRCEGVRKVVPMAIDLIRNSERFNRSEEKEHSIMIIGVPNVGKSSLVNILRNRHLNRKAASQVGAVAGITRSLLTRIKISEDPLIYLLDTPGVLLPNVGSDEIGMKLALCSCFQDHQVGEDMIADYLLFWLNKHRNFNYLDTLGLDDPTDDITLALLSGANKLGKTVTLKSFDGDGMVVKPDLLSAAKYFINAFRRGEFGKVSLDKIE